MGDVMGRDVMEEDDNMRHQVILQKETLQREMSMGVGVGGG